MNKTVDAESIVSVIGTFLDLNAGDEATEELIINIGSELLNVSQDKMLELLVFA